MKPIIILIVLVVIVLLLKKVLFKNSFGATTSYYTNPNIFVDPTQNVIPVSITGTNFNTSLSYTPPDKSNSFITTCNLQTCTQNIKCFDINPDLTLKTNFRSFSLDLSKNQDSTLVNFYLINDSFANAFMNNFYQLIPIPQVPDITPISTTVPKDGSGMAQSISYNGTNYQIISYNNAINLPKTYTSRTLVILGVLNALINLYYSPVTVNLNGQYPGLINDLQVNYIIYTPSLGPTSSIPGKASTQGITFSPTAKHAIWLYLMARANWINNQLNDYRNL